MVLMSVFNYYSQPQEQVQEMNYSAFLEQVKSGSIEQVQIQESAGGKTITGQTSDGRPFTVMAPRDDGLIKDLLDNEVDIEAKEPEGRSLLLDILISLAAGSGAGRFVDLLHAPDAGWHGWARRRDEFRQVSRQAAGRGSGQGHFQGCGRVRRGQGRSQ